MILKPSSFRQSQEVKVKDIYGKRKGFVEWIYFRNFFFSSSSYWPLLFRYFTHGNKNKDQIFIAVKAIGHVSENHINRGYNFFGLYSIKIIFSNLTLKYNFQQNCLTFRKHFLRNVLFFVRTFPLLSFNINLSKRLSIQYVILCLVKGMLWL